MGSLEECLKRALFDSTLTVFDVGAVHGFVRWHADHMVDAADHIPRAPTRRRPGRTRVVVWLVVVVLAGLLLWAIEAGSPERIDATGVDELVVPWPDPDPSAFVEQIDNPWLPLAVGATWVYVGQVDGLAATRTVSVLEESREVAGIRATVVREHHRDEDGREVETIRFYAQDRDGNVWLLGQEGEWQIGPDVAAGLAMAADPRRGDASIRVPWSGEEREVVRIGESDGEAHVPAGDFRDLLQVREIYGASGGREVEVLLARGVGEIARTWGLSNHLELEAAPPER